ncbi:hypothetical protein BJ741DRAFT_609213 [Chytriomyces cf. hyalinus JEL632]|nr:hypothetical protein BJ741DRAFT_609213 [Chytriomyces cf. hyalinus JEL632]
MGPNNRVASTAPSRQSTANALAAFVAADAYAHTVAERPSKRGSANESSDRGKEKDKANEKDSARESFAENESSKTIGLCVSLPPGVVPSAPLSSSSLALRVTVERIAWRMPTSPNRRLKATLEHALRRAIVIVDWWGCAQDASQAVKLFPRAVSSRSSTATTTRLPNPATSPTTALFPVASSKHALNSYLRDMNALVLKIAAIDGTQIGVCVIRNMQIVAGEPYAKPLTGWFPIMSQSVSEHQLGELHFSAVLENNHSYASASPTLSNSAMKSRLTTAKRKTKARSSIVKDDYDLDRERHSATGRQSSVREENERTSQTWQNENEDQQIDYDSDNLNEASYHDANVTVIRPIYDESALEIPRTPPRMTPKPNPVLLNQHPPSQPNFSLGQNDRIGVTSTRSSTSIIQKQPSFTSTTSTDSLSQAPLHPHSQLKSTGTKNSSDSSIATNVAFSDIYTRALRLKEEISAAMNNSSKLSHSKPNLRATSRTNSVDLFQDRNDEDENLISNLDETYANDTDYRVMYSVADQKTGSSTMNAGQNHYETDEVLDDSESDVLEDDLLIEALNSRFGSAIASHPGNPSRANEKNDDLSENSEEEQAELERILRQLSSDEGELDEPEFARPSRNRKQSDNGPSSSLHPSTRNEKLNGRRQVVSDDSPNAHSFLSLDTLTKLGRVHSVRIYINKLEAKTNSLSPFLTSFVVDYEWNSGSGVETSEATNSQNIVDNRSNFKMASRLVSSALPRILSSNVAGGSKKGPRFASHDSVVSFDKQDIFPVVFDGNLAVSWLDASLNLNVVATQNAGGTKASTGLATKAKNVGDKIPRKTLWQAQGSWKCREVLSDSEFYWTGRIPLFSVGSSKNDSGHLSKKGPETRHIGDIVLTVELISNLLRLPKAVQERPSTPKPIDHGTSSSAEVPIKPEIDNAAEITIEKRHFHLPPHYVFISITTARGLAVFPSLNETSPTLLHLSLRLFSSSTPPTTTPPLPYLPPFDLSTGRLNPPLNFDYAVTVPVAITEAFLEKAKELVVEVWALSPHYPQSRTTFTSADSNDELVGPISTSDALENSTAELIEDGRRLLGLLRLPFDYLVATVAAGLRENGNLSSTENQTPPDMDPPVLLPEAEYAIVDPFSGISKGWVKAFLAVGTWSQIARMQKNGIDGVDVTQQRIAKTETASAPVEPFIQRSRHEQLNAEKQFMERVEKIPQNASGARVEADGQSSTSDDPVSCALQISVHALCGLRGLLASFIRNRFNDESAFIGSSAADSSTLDVAHSMGPKTYVKIQVSLAEFPEPVPENHELFGIRTPCAPRSFTPKFNFTETLEIHVIDTKFLRWIKQGGCAVGEIWQQGAEGKDILLGTFKVPLQRLLGKANGVWKEWVLVEAANRMSTESDGIRADAAAQISIQFKNGFGFMDSNNLPSSANFGSASIDGNRTGCDMKVSISELKLSLADSREDNDSGLFYARWSHPIVTEDGLQQATLKSHTHALSLEESGERVLVHFGWNETVEFEMQTDIFNLLQNSGLKIEVVQKSLNGAESSFGFAKVDLWDAVCRIRKAHRKNDTRFVRVDGVFPVINPNADDLRTASIDVSVEFSLSGRERSVFSKKENKTDEIPVKPQLQTVGDSTIGARMDPTVQITIDRSIQLPKIYGLHPNTYATLTWPLDNTYLSTHIVPNNDSPAWKCEFIVRIPRSEMELRRMKFDCYLVEVIAWHCDETAYDLAAGTVDSNRAVKLGSAFVDVSPLFSGCREIHGWYPLTGDNHVQHGQILVRIAPSENLGSALMNAAGPKAEVATFLKVGPAAASSLPPTLALPGLQNGKPEAVGLNSSISQNGRQSQEPHPVISPSSPTAPTSMQLLNESMGIQAESHPVVTDQLGTQETVDSESVFAIEDFSRSLQKTVDELNALQDLIRSRGLKGLPLFKDASSLHREELEGTQNQAIESLSGLVPAEPISGLEPSHENETKTAQSEDGDRLTLEDLNFNFEEDQTGSIVKADWSDLIAKAQQHESQGHQSVNLDHDEPRQASGDTRENFANSIIHNSHQSSQYRSDLNPALTVSPKSVHKASDSESNSDDETDAFILSLLQSQRGSNRSSPFSRSRTSPPQRKLALHDEMKSTAERYMLLSQNESRRRSPLNPSTTAAKPHAPTHSDAEKDGSRSSDDGSESDDEDSVFGISTKRTAITFGKPPLHQPFHSQKKPAAHSASVDFDAWETKYKTRSHDVRQTDSRLRQFLHSVGSDSSVLSHEEESETGADDSDDFSMVFSSSKKKWLEKEAAAKPNDISMSPFVGSSERKNSDSKLKDNSSLLGGRELRYAEDEEIREILFRSRQTRAEALDKVKRMKMQGLPERADATTYVSKATAIPNKNSTRDPAEKSGVPDGDRNGEGHQNLGESDARRIAKIFYNNGDSSE